MLKFNNTSLLLRQAVATRFCARPLVSQKFNFSTSKVQTSSSDAENDAKCVLQAVPGQDKTYNLLIGSLGATALFSKELIPWTPDIVYMAPFTVTMVLAFKYVGPFLTDITGKVVAEKDKQWADAKSKAEEKLNDKIEEITGSGITELVEITEDLFDHAEDLAKMEAEAFEHTQNVEFFAKAKQILDDWVRYETGERERQQKAIAEQVISSVMASVKDPQFQQKYLEQCIQDIQGSLAR